MLEERCKVMFYLYSLISQVTNSPQGALLSAAWTIHSTEDQEDEMDCTESIKKKYDQGSNFHAPLNPNIYPLEFSHDFNYTALPLIPEDKKRIVSLLDCWLRHSNLIKL